MEGWDEEEEEPGRGPRAVQNLGTTPLASFTMRSLQTGAIDVMLSSFYVQPLGVWLMFFVNSGVWCSRIDLESNPRQVTSCCYRTINAYQ
jgi:hypothetical protein